MKPTTLALTGFRSYPTQTTIDFTGKSLVAVLGDTGAGKSSLLDAITFALFRKSSWDSKEPRQLIADGAQGMSVELTFVHDGQNWRVHRTMHATNPNGGRHLLKNLDTGEETDGATAVDRRIKTVLQMSYETFLRVGLLPQGRFDQLLTAAPRERSERLRELFGAESLENVRDLASRQGRALQQLVGDAKAKRAPMPDNPREAAAAAGVAADAAKAQADRLNAAISHITALQDEISHARGIEAAATKASQSLATHTVTDVSTILDTLECAATELATRRDLLDRRTEQAEARENELSEAITAAESHGEGRDALAQASMLLKSLAETAAGHRYERDRLTGLTTQLENERDAIGKAETELAQRATHVKTAAEAAHAAAETSRQIRSLSTTAGSALNTALADARRIAEAVRDHATALSEQESAHKKLGQLEAGVAAANEDVTAAETHLEALQLHRKGAALAAELAPGDDCPVCRRQLPDDFHPASADAEELTEALTQREQTKSAQSKAMILHAEAAAAVTAADKAVREQDHRRTSAQQTLRDATRQADETFRSLEALAATASKHFDARAASAKLAAATAAVAATTTAAPHQQHLEHGTTATQSAIATCEREAAEHADKLRAEEFRLTAAVEAERKSLAERTKTHRRDQKEASAAQERHTRALARTADDIGMLPARIQATLPHNPIDIAVEQTDAAAIATKALQTSLQELLDQRETARTERAAALADLHALERDAHTFLEHPLERLRDRLDDWTRAADRARTQLDETDQPALPEAPDQPVIADVRQYSAVLTATTSLLGEKLLELATTATERASVAESRLGEHAAALADFDAPSDLTTPGSLHPLVRASTQASDEAEKQRREQREAQDLIKPAADLDFAIAAGEARYEALEVLRRELVDAKFLGHLTMLRTHALLGVASDLLGQMSDGRFGFADDFDIVSRTSGVVHQPNRLSGGEKFMASLALALALAELHSRSGPTLGSLFLDEGFAALDTTALDLALEVLRAQAGGDRLVMVISHLHAVAEAVDDVLLVERTAAGSSTRWLTPAERDDMAQDNLASGLHSQAR
ncbi:AAA family ATPase [Streptomyces sp. NPDC001927]